MASASVPWLGLYLYGMGAWKRNLVGGIMFLGQMILYCLSYIDAVFSTPQRILHLIDLKDLKLCFFIVLIHLL